MAALKPFVVVAKRLEKSGDKRDKDINLLQEVGKYEFQQDACSAYCAMIPNEGDRTPITIFENYDSKEYLLDDIKGHRSSKEYQTFKEIETKEDMLQRPTEVAFYETKCGFLHREDAPKIPATQQFVWIAKLTAKPGKRGEIIDACRIHTENVRRTEDGTLTFLVLESVDNDVDVLLFERYESEKYFKDVHFTSESMKEYRSKMGEILEGRDSSGYSIVAGFLDKRELS